MRHPTPSGFLSIVLLTIAILANVAIPWQAIGDTRDKPNTAAICIGLAARSRSAADFDPDDEDGDGLTNTTEQTRTFTDPCWADTDDDGLLDPWEVDPAKVDPAVDKAGFNLDTDPEIEATRDEVFGPYAENGSPGLIDETLRPSALFSMFVHPPSPLHKDIYFELDWQDCLQRPNDCPEPGGITGLDPTHHAPDIIGISDVVNVFNSAPPANPDGKTGIYLHILVDERIQHIPNCDRGTSNIRNQFFGTDRQRGASNRNNILQAKERAFRYIWSGHSTAPTPSQSDPADATLPCPKPGVIEFTLSGMGAPPARI